MIGASELAVPLFEGLSWLSEGHSTTSLLENRDEQPDWAHCIVFQRRLPIAASMHKGRASKRSIAGQFPFNLSVLFQMHEEPRNGFSSVTERDATGWTPLCYASLLGNPMLVYTLSLGFKAPRMGGLQDSGALLPHSQIKPSFEA